MSGGSYSIDFSAADPSEYIPPIPFPQEVTPIVGRGNGDTQIDRAWFADPVTGVEVNVESLAPQDMALGQVVPFEIEIVVDGSTEPENGVITFTAGWNIDTTANDDFGYDDALGVIAAFVDTGDGAFIDPEGDATVQAFSWAVVGDEIVATFTVSGLDDGDRVVIEPWLVLDKTIPADANGNVQSRLIDAETATGDVINTGNQTVPLQAVQQFFNAEVDLSITKVDEPDPVTQGEPLTYTITVTNAGPSIANNVQVVDDLDPNVQFVSAPEGGVFNDNGTPDDHTDDTVTWNLGALAAGDSVKLTLNVLVNDDAPFDSPTGEDLLNTVRVTTDSDDIDPDNDTAIEFTNVEPREVVSPAIRVVKEATPVIINEGGENVTYTYAVTNESTDPADNELTITSLVDDRGTPDDTADDVDLLAAGAFVNGDDDNDGLLDTGETWHYSFTTNVLLNANESLTNTATVTGEDADNNEATDTDVATVTAQDVAPDIHVEKKVDANKDGKFHDIEFLKDANGKAVYKYVVTNTSAASTDSELVLTSLVDDRGTADTADDVNLLNGFQSGVSHGAFFVRGDTDNDFKIDSGEKWVFKAKLAVPAGDKIPTKTHYSDSYFDNDYKFDSLKPFDHKVKFPIPDKLQANTNTVTARGMDDEGSIAMDTDTATVKFIKFDHIKLKGEHTYMPVGHEWSNPHDHVSPQKDDPYFHAIPELGHAPAFEYGIIGAHSAHNELF